MTGTKTGIETGTMTGGWLTLCLAAILAMLAVGGCAGPSAELYAKRPGARGAQGGQGVVGWKEEGKATFYAPRLAGHRTANGEIYDPQKLTAAHPILPFGTRVAVERTDVHLPAVVVRINDRCAAGKKIIDLSEAAAHRLNMMKIGIVPVHLRVISASH
jgi:rare lipoprotein A